MNAFLEYLVKYVQLLRISDLIDILIVSVIVYYLINLIRETRAMQLVKGIIFLFIALFNKSFIISCFLWCICDISTHSRSTFTSWSPWNEKLYHLFPPCHI